VPTRAQQDSADSDGRRDEAPALRPLANPRRIRWATRARRPEGNDLSPAAG
jgi:hypothetical protein